MANKMFQELTIVRWARGQGPGVVGRGRVVIHGCMYVINGGYPWIYLAIRILISNVCLFDICL